MKRFARRTATACLLVGATFGTGSLPAPASESLVFGAASVRPDSHTFATFVVNGEERGEHIIILRTDGVYAAIEDLKAAGLSIAHKVEVGAVHGYVRLANLSPEIRATFDPQGPTVRLDADSADSLTRRSSISITPTQDRFDEVSRERSGYLNYSLNANTNHTWSAAQELTLSDSSKTFFLSGVLDRGGFRGTTSNLTWNDDLKRKRIMVGDVFGDSGDLGSTLIIRGISVARSFDSTPNEQRTASPILYGTALTPSTADVYLNGQLIRTVEVPPGAFDFRDLPAGGGSNDAKIILRDAFGHTQTLSSRYYDGTAILRSGETDYSYSLGQTGKTPGRSPSVAGLVALGRYRLGVSRSTTIGAHAELANGFENFATSFDHTSRLGISHLAIAQSRDRNAAGFAGSIRYTFGNARVWATGSLEAATANYFTLAQRGFPDRTILQQQFNVGMRPFRGNYTTNIAYTASRARFGSYSRQFSWQHTLPLARGVFLLLSTGVSTTPNGSHPNFSAFLLRTGGKDARDTTSLSLRADGGALQPAMEVQHATPFAGGSGYDLNIYPSRRMLSTGRYALRSSIGNIDVDYGLARGESLTGNVALSGAVAFAGKYARFSQPIADSFALIKVDGGERVRVLIDNQDAGMTDRHGFLVLPNLRSYYGKRIGVVRDDGPANLNVSGKEQNIVIASRRGAVAQFTASMVTAIIGKVIVLDRGRQSIPAYGELSLTAMKGPIAADLDVNGRFYFENVTSGHYQATIRYGGGECRFTLAVPHTVTIEANIGTFTCVHS